LPLSVRVVPVAAAEPCLTTGLAKDFPNRTSAGLVGGKVPFITMMLKTIFPDFGFVVTVTLPVDDFEQGAFTVIVPNLPALADAGIAKSAAVAQSAAIEIRPCVCMVGRLDEAAANPQRPAADPAPQRFPWTKESGPAAAGAVARPDGQD